ncbi:complement C5 [Gouania willdenowi]|uniref:complement C5 n=1 Tax=Gouania willdenowi TaxID=441366 RepID=UPI001055AA59|nr:complement C5 [Gouania willdenowi]
MKVCVLLCVCFFSLKMGATSRSYLVAAPLSFRVDALETVLLQLFGFTEEVTVFVFLKTSLAPDHQVLAQDVVKLNAQNHHQATATVRLLPQLDKSTTNVVLHIQCPHINEHVSVPVSRSNGFLFIQTDKPLYTPHQLVKVRAFSLNQELRPAKRSVLLTFRDPDHSTVDIVKMIDPNNGVPSMQNPFRIPISPKLGIWTITASYSEDFSTLAQTNFEVKEYVLPSFTISIEPEANYISYDRFSRFNFKVSARYLHGAPVSNGEVFLRYGYISGNNRPVIIPNSVRRLSSSGHVMVMVNMQQILSNHNMVNDLSGLMNKYLYIAVLVKERYGGISQEFEFAAVKFVKSPFTLSLVSTPPFIKPRLPYNIQVLVKDHLDHPVSQVPIHLVERRVFRIGRDSQEVSCTPKSQISQPDGIAVFSCSIPLEAVRAELTFQTADPALPALSQARLSLSAQAYHSPNQRYLYIDAPGGSTLTVGNFANIKVYSATPQFITIRSISYMVVSRGRVLTFGTQAISANEGNRHTLSFRLTGAMFPSVRLLVYYLLFSEGTSELVADSVWLDVRDTCVNGLKTELSVEGRSYKPAEKLTLNIRTNQDGLVALSAVDTALLHLRSNYRDPVAMVVRHIEQSDLGCGGGGGKDGADVFRLAGLTFMTNANAQAASSTQACTALVRPKRAPNEEARNARAASYGRAKVCCEVGMRFVPKTVSCQQFAQQAYRKKPLCQRAFRECCQFIQDNLDQDQDLILGRNDFGPDFDTLPVLVRSSFPESWLWDVRPVRSGQLSVNESLPHSLNTWQIQAIGMFGNGICVANPVQVSVSLPLSVDVPLPYQVVRGEQVELKGSVYNQRTDGVMYCVTLRAGPDICLHQSQPDTDGQHSTACSMRFLPARSVGAVSFTLLAFQPGEHRLTFTLSTTEGGGDVLQKKLRVVPEGLRQEVNSGGTLDPQGVYGSEKRTVYLTNKLPLNMVPNTPVKRMLSISGEVLGDTLTLVLSSDGLQELVNLPSGSAEAELGRVRTLLHVYQYLEASSSWKLLGHNVQKSSEELKQKIREGVVSVSSFRNEDFGYSMWRKKKSSTWVTALVLQTLSLADQIVTVDHQSLSDSMFWLIWNTQNSNGSFRELSSFRANRAMAEGAEPVERDVYLTSFVLIALKRVTSINDPILQIRVQDASKASAENYISQHASGVNSVFVRAVATFALTLNNPNNMVSPQLFKSLEGLARESSPAELRYWQDSNVLAEWVNPDQTSSQTVETTAYVLLTTLLLGKVQYAQPILLWLRQDQHYEQGFFSTEDTVLTLEAVTAYSKVISKADLNQDISIRIGRKGERQVVSLSSSQPVITPIQVTTNDDIRVTTGFGNGVSTVKLKTVFYETSPSTQSTCNFDLTIEAIGADLSNRQVMRAPHLVACVKYKPPEGVVTESRLTIMTIQLPTGVNAYVNDLRQFSDVEVADAVISHYELQGNNVIIQAESIPSDVFVCFGFRIRTSFRVGGATQALFTVHEAQHKGSLCTKHFSYEQTKLQRLCVEEQCQCMTTACATFRGKMDTTLTVANRTAETCQPHIRYAYKVSVKSSEAEGDFWTFTATVDQVLRKNDPTLAAVSARSEVELVKKATCSEVHIQIGRQYLLMGASSAEVKGQGGLRYRLALDSDAVLEALPSDCSSTECSDYNSLLDDFITDLQLFAC